MKILITGANGQLGSELKDVFSGSSYEVYLLDRQQLPLDQTVIIQDILAIYEPDYIIHAGAYTAVDKAESDSAKAYAVNQYASGEIAQYCRMHGAKLIAISTDYVFDGNSSTPLKEEAAVSPINVYGDSKLKGEQEILKWAPESIIIRTSWVYSIYGKNFVKTMLRLMHDREEISVINDQIGSPTYARDLAEAIFKIIESGNWNPGVYHFSNEGQISWYDFAKAIKEIASLDCNINPISTKQYPTPAKRPKFSLLDKQKIKAVYQVKVPEWKDSLQLMMSRL